LQFNLLQFTVYCTWSISATVWQSWPSWPTGEERSEELISPPTKLSTKHYYLLDFLSGLFTPF